MPINIKKIAGCLMGLFFSFAGACSIHTNIINDKDSSSGLIEVNDISEELSALESEQRSMVLGYAAKAFTWATDEPSVNTELDDAVQVSWFGYYYFKSNDAELFTDQSQDDKLRDYVGRGFLELLDASQRQLIYDSLSSFSLGFDQLLLNRNNILEVLQNYRNGATFDEDRIKQLSRLQGEVEGDISDMLAKAYGSIMLSLKASQIEDIGRLRTNDLNYTSSSEVDQEIAALDSVYRGYITKVASRAFTWISGDKIKNETLDPGCIASYFGFSSYKNETTPIDAIVEPPRLRSDIGELFLKILPKEKRQLFYNLPSAVNSTYQEYLQNRTSVITALMEYQTDTGADGALVKSLIKESGSINGLMTIAEARVYVDVLNSLSDIQLNYLLDVRNGSVNWMVSN